MFTHGGELIARALAGQGVNTLYTLSGGHILPIYEGCLNNNIRVIDMRHEQAAAHAADAHARLTHNIGAAAVTAGPGVTDAVTGVANAYQARSPMILLGGAAPLSTKGMGALQEMPQVEMFKSITKASFTITNTAIIPDLMAEAFKTALSGRPGPVFIEIPFDVLFNAVDPPKSPFASVEIEPQTPQPADISRIIELLKNARKPIIIAGTQVYWDNAGDALQAFTQQSRIPVFTNGAGRGTLSMTHPNCFKASRSAALKESDLVLLIGTPLDFRLKYGQGWNLQSKLVQIENDPAELNHNRQADVSMLADARLTLEALQQGAQGIRFDDWLSQMQEVEGEKSAKLERWKRLDDAPVNHFRFGAAIDNFIDEDTILIGDGGDIVSASAKVITLTRPGQWLDPGPLGCLGVGAPFAIAAKNLYPRKKVLIINGDGSFGLNGFEFDTALRFNLPIVSIVGNDAGWGQIRGPQVQMVGKDRAVATKLASTRYDKIVAAMGGYGEYVTKPAELEAALKRAFASGKAACINVALDPEGMSKTGASSPYIV